jgi:DNA-binding response OmpR family regulator
MNRIAIIEDHERLAKLLCKGLSDAGITADVFGEIESAWQAARGNQYMVFVIDRGLPDGDGLDFVRRLRTSDMGSPCLMLTARDALHDRVGGLDAGADDYLTKPFEMQEFVARVRALMRRPAALRSLSPEFRDIVVRPESGCLVCGAESVTLPPAELQIILSLIQANGQAVRRTALEAAAWGVMEAVTPNALDVAVHRLKRKLLAIRSVLQIVNIRGYGYALR